MQIINCHVHTFTTRHTPRYFPHRVAVLLRYAPWLVRFLRFVSWFGPPSWYSFMLRLETFHRTGTRSSQREVFREALHYYPRDARFVVLPVDMGPIGHGPVEDDIRTQHDELHRLSKDPDYGPNVIPFACVHPDTPGGAQEFRRCVEELGFKGLKIYPKMGFSPTHPVLMEEVYPLCAERGLPVVTHCSRGGVWKKGWTRAEWEPVSRPEAYVEVLERFPELNLNLAHFGGEADWIEYVSTGFDPDDPHARERNWVWRIREMLASRTWPNLWTDISYTIFKFEEFAPLLRLFLKEEAVRERTLFGSDFYMTRQEELSEKAISIRLRDTLGEDLFRQISETNPRRFLGLPPAGDGPVAPGGLDG